MLRRVSLPAIHGRGALVNVGVIDGCAVSTYSIHFSRA